MIIYKNIFLATQVCKSSKTFFSSFSGLQGDLSLQLNAIIGKSYEN